MGTDELLGLFKLLCLRLFQRLSYSLKEFLSQIKKRSKWTVMVTVASASMYIAPFLFFEEVH